MHGQHRATYAFACTPPPSRAAYHTTAQGPVPENRWCTACLHLQHLVTCPDLLAPQGSIKLQGPVRCMVADLHHAHLEQGLPSVAHKRSRCTSANSLVYAGAVPQPSPPPPLLLLNPACTLRRHQHAPGHAPSTGYTTIPRPPAPTESQRDSTHITQLGVLYRGSSLPAHN